MNLRKTWLSALAIGVMTSAASAATPQPAAKVSPEAEALVKQMAAAYGGLDSLQLAGTFTSELAAAGEEHSEQTPFTALFRAPNRYRHDLKEMVNAGSTGKKVYAYAAGTDAYITADAPAGRPAVGDLFTPVRQLLGEENPSLLAAITKDPAATLTAGAADVRTAAPTVVDGTSYDTLVVSMGSDKPVTRLLVDPKTHLIRRAVTDRQADLRRRGAQDVKKALITVDYTTITPGATLADAQFAWAAPAGAKDQTAAGAEANNNAPAMELVGKPAPDFTAKQLKGGDVNLKEATKGSVVVLDFWATWCPTCIEALPHLDQLYKTVKDKGAKFYAVNMQEDEPDAQRYVDDVKLSIPVLMDIEGKVTEKYKVEPLPQTVVIGKDGAVRNVFIGGTEEQIRKAVEDALAAK